MGQIEKLTGAATEERIKKINAEQLSVAES